MYNIKKNKTFFLLIFIIFLAVASSFLILCSFPKKKLAVIEPLACNLNSPIKIFNLPDELKEISGIFYFDDESIACIQDESGKIYIYSLVNNNILELSNFQESGDYEGITYNENIFYLLRSDGLLVEVNTLKGSVEKYELETGAKNNEGLAYDKFTDKLLITTKTKIGKGEQLKDKRLVYLFNLETKKLEENPFFTIELSKIEEYAKKIGLDIEKIKFRPSGLAVHPIDKSVYVISAVDNLIIQFDRQGDILYLGRLEEVIYGKPEGITFSENGDIFISNEAVNGKATILQSCLN